MEMTGVHVVPATTEAVWHALHDPETLKCCIPGCASIEPDGENAYRMALTANVGPVSARFAGKVKIADGEAPRAYTIRFEGTGGPAGFVNGEASVILTPGEAGSTTLSYAARAQVGGKLAQIGSRLIDGAAHKLTDEFFTRFVETMRPAVEAPALAPARAQRRIPYVAIAVIVVAATVVYLLVRRS